MWPVPAWLKDVSAPTDEEFEAIDRRMMERQLESDAVEAAAWRRGEYLEWGDP